MLKPYYSPGVIEAGCDEAGRGCLAGPVSGAAVILPPSFHHPLLNDSKQLSAKHRELLKKVIEDAALAYSVQMITPKQIDQINILNASILAMQKAVAHLKIQAELILVDGNRFHKYEGIPHKCIVKGDSIYASIAAASILAKTYRDAYMQTNAEKYPGYGWERNMGYPTKEHRRAIEQLGPTPLHRRSFKLTNPQLSLHFAE